MTGQKTSLRLIGNKPVINCFSNSSKVTLDLRTYGQVLGILIGEDEAWVTLRRFTLKTLKDFGFGKKGSEIIVQEEADMLCQHFRQFAGKQFEMSTIFNIPVVNVLWQMVISKRFKVSILKKFSC